MVFFNFVAIRCSDKLISVQDWDDIKNNRIAYLRGWKIYETNVGTGHNVKVLNNPESLFGMLKEDRVDLILYSKLRALDYMKAHQLSGLEIIDPPLSQKPMFLYIHLKHKAFIPLIETELRKLKANGRYEHLYNTFLLDLD